LKHYLGLADVVGSKPCTINVDGSLNIRFRTLTYSNPLKPDNAVYLNWLSIIWLLIIGFLTSWFIFALVYWMMELISGNVCDIGVFQGCGFNVSEEGLREHRCVSGVYDFPSALQFSIETMTTVGYGTRHVNSGILRCYITVIAVIIQSMVGLILMGIFTGLLITKFKHSAPNKKIVSFSPSAVINARRGKLQLEIVIRSQRKLYEPKVEGVMITDTRVTDDEHLTRCFHSVQFGMETYNDVHESFANQVPHVMWPISVCHEIDKTSPIYNYSPDMTNFKDFELIILLQGITATGNTVSVRKSYIKSEIVWGGYFNFDNVLYERPPAYMVMVDDSGLNVIDVDKDFSKKSACARTNEGTT